MSDRESSHTVTPEVKLELWLVHHWRQMSGYARSVPRRPRRIVLGGQSA